MSCVNLTRRSRCNSGVRCCYRAREHVDPTWSRKTRYGGDSHPETSSPTNKNPGYGAFPPDSVQLRSTLPVGASVLCRMASTIINKPKWNWRWYWSESTACITQPFEKEANTSDLFPSYRTKLNVEKHIPTLYKKPRYCPRLDWSISYCRKGVFRNNFGITTPEFLISPSISGWVSCGWITFLWEGR